MAGSIVRGNTITLTAHMRDASGALVDPASDPQVSILDADGVTIVNLAAPTAHPSVGTYQYAYPVPADAQPGAWAAQWFATIGGNAVFDEDGFTVELASATTTTVAGTVVCSVWATHVDVTADYSAFADDADADEACAVASDILFLLTGSRWPGVCHAEIRPQAQFRQSERATWMQSVQGARSQYGWCSCNRGRAWGCNSLPEIRLPHRPVDPDSIVVTLDGAAFTDFTLLDGAWLVRTDGNGWPCCQRTELPLTEDHTFGVEYDHGAGPPLGGVRAAASLGFQLLAGWRNNSACKLPQRIQTVTRQGVSMTVLDPLNLFKDGLTGVPDVDLWVASVMVGNKRRPGTIGTVGKMPRTRRTS